MEDLDDGLEEEISKEVSPGTAQCRILTYRFSNRLVVKPRQIAFCFSFYHLQIFSSYTCRSLNHIVKAHPHPGDIAEPASLAAISLPPSTYPLAFPPDIISSGKLSALQLEGIVQACTKHLTWLPSGERAGFFIGDGAGVGKGRQISGVILDSYLRGRPKSVWITTSTDLYADAVRDLRDLGAFIPVFNNLQSLDKSTNTAEGVMFMTYSTLTSTIRGRSRLDQLLKWLGGPSFEGVLVFDEAHKSKHYSEKEGQGSKVATAVVELQRALPAARVLYCSATGVSEVGNMAYMSRLGLFGSGSSFPTFEHFLNSLKRKGISFMEMLAMELKGEGFYVARGLSFRCTEFVEVEVALDERQIEMYDAAVEVWTDIRRNLAELVALYVGVRDPWRPFWAAQQRFFKLLCVSVKVPTVVSHAKQALDQGNCVIIGLQSTGEAAADALSLCPGTMCRTWISVTKEILLSFLKTHFPVTCVKREAENTQTMPRCVTEDKGTDVDHDAHQQAEVVIEEAVNIRDKLIERVEALRLPNNFLDELIDQLGGKHAVAEMTGRKARVVRDRDGHLKYEARANPDSSEMDSLNIKEKDNFMSGRKLIAIVSDAASTGISLHADARAPNQRRRIHITIELPWSADKAIQQLGRSHRSNQTSAPLYKVVFTNLGGERRFAAAVARRLQSLGALTPGDRRAASGLDLGSMNYDSQFGRKALRRMYDAFLQESPVLPPGVSLQQLFSSSVLSNAGSDVRIDQRFDTFEALHALNAMLSGEKPFQLPSGPSRSVDNENDGCAVRRRATAADVVDLVLRLHATLRTYVEAMGSLQSSPSSDRSEHVVGAKGTKDTGDVKKFLNRLLAVPVHRQQILFAYFQSTMDAEIRVAKAAGLYAEGVSDLPGQTVSKRGESRVLWTDPRSGLSTVWHEVDVDRGVCFDAAVAILERERHRVGDASGFYRSKRTMPWSGRHGIVLAIQKSGTRDQSGTFTIVRPNTGRSFIEMDADELFGKYQNVEVGGVDDLNDVESEQIKALWETVYEEALLTCLHGGTCVAGPECSVGKRLNKVTILSGSIVRIWECLETVLQRNEASLSKADRTMRIVRVEGLGTGPELPLIGLRYPGHLLSEVLAMLEHAYGGGEVLKNGKRKEPEAVGDVDGRALKRAFTAPKTVLDFFKPLNIKNSSDESVERTVCAEKVNDSGFPEYIEKKSDSIAEQHVASLVALGFDRTKAEQAMRLMKCVEKAADWLLSQPC